MDEEQFKKMMMALGIGANDEAPEVYDPIIRFLQNGETITFEYNEDSQCWHINNSEDRVIWFSQLNGIYISFDENLERIQGYGSSELLLLDGQVIKIDEISSRTFIQTVKDKKFNVSINPTFHYYIYNKKRYSKDSDEFQNIINSINKDSYQALTNKIIKKGNCYILKEIPNE